MGNVEGEDNVNPERQRMSQDQNLITNFVQREESIRNEGYVDTMKLGENIRMLALNVKGINPWNEEKMEMFLTSIEEHQIDIMILNETNTKWNPANIDKMEQNLKRLGREIKTHTADSKSWKLTASNHLPGGVLTVFRCKSRSLLIEETN